MFLTARAMHGLLRGCWAVSVCSLQGPRALGGSGGDESEPREGPQGSVSPLGSWLLFPGGGGSPSSQEGKPFIFPPLCWEHYTCVGGNDNVELNEN